MSTRFLVKFFDMQGDPLRGGVGCVVSRVPLVGEQFVFSDSDDFRTAKKSNRWKVEYVVNLARDHGGNTMLDIEYIVLLNPDSGIGLIG